MMKKMLVLGVWIFLGCLFVLKSGTSFALSKVTHEYIDNNISVGNWNGFYLNSYIKNVLLLDYGVNEVLGTGNVSELIGIGGVKEDDPGGFPLCVEYLSRSTRHFHNPLNDNGYMGLWDSAVLWGQRSIGDQAFFCGNYSWFDVRDYFVQALASPTEDARRHYLAESFRGLGQLMHLVQDMSVPEHTRNDTHIKYSYEGWVEQNHDTVVRSSLLTPFYPNANLVVMPSAFANNAPVPIANLFDTNQYDGTNPEITVLDSVGLSEYTNANFISPDTVFTSPFPFPAYADMFPFYELVDNTYMFIYVKKVGAGDNIVHFAAANRYYNALPADSKQLGLGLDKKVYQDYAQKLLPRAVGYSVELMKYFFRGALEVSRPDENVYSVIDGSVSQSFRKIKAKVRNNTPSEEAGSGTLHAIAKYKVRNDYLPDLSHDPPNQPPPEVNYSYSVSAPVIIDNSIEALRLKSDNPNSYLFDFSSSSIPAGITDLTIMIVFKGTLGYESDSAIAVGSNDLMEPAHHVYFNLTDMFAINGHLWTAQQIRDNTTLLSQVGTAYIDPYPMTVAVSYVNQAPPMPIITPEIDITVADLSPGDHFELIVLVDNNNYIRVTEADDIDPGIDTRYTGYIGFRNQSYGGTWTSTPGQLLLFRHDAAGNPVRTNFYTGWLRCTPYEGGYCPYPENEATVPLPGLSPVPVQILGDFGL